MTGSGKKSTKVSLMPSPEFGDLAIAFANPTGSESAAPEVRRPRGRPKSEDDLVNQTLSIRADQLRRLHAISASEYARLGRRVLPSEVVRVLLDRALAVLPDDGQLLQ